MSIAPAERPAIPRCAASVQPASISAHAAACRSSKQCCLFARLPSACQPSPYSPPPRILARVVDLLTVIDLDDVMLGSGGWGWPGRVVCGEHQGNAHCGKNHQSDDSA